VQMFCTSQNIILCHLKFNILKQQHIDNIWYHEISMGENSYVIETLVAWCVDVVRLRRHGIECSLVNV
jgi:hypothetical protein